MKRRKRKGEITYQLLKENDNCNVLLRFQLHFFFLCLGSLRLILIPTFSFFLLFHLSGYIHVYFILCFTFIFVSISFLVHSSLISMYFIKNIIVHRNLLIQEDTQWEEYDQESIHSGFYLDSICVLYYLFSFHTFH